MSTLKNQVQLIGNVGQEPQVTVLENGKKVARISLATNENFKNSKGEKQTNTDWHQLVAWGKVASLIEEYVFTGKEIAVQGKLSSRSYEDKEGVKRHVTEVVVSEILFLGGSPK
ncbi:single-stranded DNA-binding protein [Galbibacter pacificus]|uniref:Single-stranded DNA-binding protein n=1 Tax=Galbibacter pacificus TaxID=2996052 RepID=A0ABT6FSG0_9FLAO|nr:single-stranded DNA-binding protein [Galbibacter pacificus]MDG3582839.1 single-stranded DNA-binding protein [Galbibacter pacificus]MDG3586042.1 single-stranded DNA-binding protein [Galbibacter pacificus]